MAIIFRPIIRILLNAGILYLLVTLVPSIQYSGDWKFFLIGGVFLGLINLTLKPIMKFLSLPMVILTGGLFLIFINIVVLWFLEYFISVIQVEGVTLFFPNFTSYAIGAIVFGLINWGAGLII